MSGCPASARRSPGIETSTSSAPALLHRVERLAIDARRPPCLPARCRTGSSARRCATPLSASAFSDRAIAARNVPGARLRRPRPPDPRPPSRRASIAEIGDGARQRTADVLGVRQRNDAVAARQALACRAARTGCCCADGIRIEPQVSLPMPAAAKLAATAAPVPPLDPPGLRVGSYGLRVWPPSELIVVMPAASSCRFVLPMMTAPASRSRFT